MKIFCIFSSGGWDSNPRGPAYETGLEPLQSTPQCLGLSDRIALSYPQILLYDSQYLSVPDCQVCYLFMTRVQH